MVPVIARRTALESRGVAVRTQIIVMGRIDAHDIAMTYGRHGACDCLIITMVAVFDSVVCYDTSGI